MNILTVDFETYWAQDFSLSKMTTEEYVRSDRFQIIGMGIKLNEGETVWLSGTEDELREYLHENYDWKNTFVLAHNTMFDGAILSWRLGITPKGWLDTMCMARALHGVDKSAALKALAVRYGVGEKGTEVLDAKGKYLEDFTEEELSKYGDYCINDVELTYHIFKIMMKDFPLKELKIIDLTLSMFTHPVLELDMNMLEEHLHEVRMRKEMLLEQAGVSREDLMSNPKFAELLVALDVTPPTKTSARTGKEAFAFAKTDEGFKALAEHEDDRVQALYEARLGNKSTLEETRTARFIGIAERGKLPVPIRYYAAHCLLGDAEVLTRSGWEPLATWGGGDIMQWEPLGTMSFLSATPNKFEVYEEPMVHFASRYHKATYTAGHTIPTVSGRGVFTAQKAGDVLGKRFELPITGLALGQADITELDARIAAMVQADGSVRSSSRHGKGVRFGFRKERKIARCIELLSQADVQHKVTIEPNGTTRIFIPSAEVHKVTKYVHGTDKVFSPTLLDAPVSVKNAFVEELKYWDGSAEPNGVSISYTSTNKNNAEFVQTMAHLCGRAAHIATRVRKVANWNTSYGVHIRGRITTTRVQPEHGTATMFSGTVYCPTTSTGYFLFRQNGVIMITGNTGRWGGADKINLQNLPSRGPNAKALKKSIVAPEGYVVVEADSSQIEARVLAWLAGQDDLVTAFHNKEDVYKIMASSIYNVKVDEVTKDQRFVGKTTILGAGYGMGANRFQEQLKGMGVELELDECRRIIAVYRNTYGNIKRLWYQANDMLALMMNKQDSELGARGATVLQPLYDPAAIRLPSGLLLRYDGLEYDRDTKEYSYQTRNGRTRIYGGKVVENVCQAIARCIIGEQMLQINKRYKVVFTVHDSVGCCVPEAEAEDALAYVMDCMRYLPDWAEGMPIDCEASFAKSYGECE